MAVPSTITDLNVVASSNGPAGTESPNTLDDYIRAQGAIIRKLYNDVTDGTVPVYNSTRVGGTTPTPAGLALIDDADAATQRQTLGLGNGGAVNTASNAVVLDASSKLPAVDGSQLTGLSAVPSGAVQFFAMSTAPSGWLKANGSAVSRTTYAALFSAIGTLYGSGDGSTTFNLPDLRGEFIRGFDDGKGTDSGRAMGSSQTDAMQGHKHDYSAIPSGSFGGGAGFNQSSNTTLQTGSPVTDGANGTPRTAAETRPRNIALLACIKA